MRSSKNATRSSRANDMAASFQGIDPSKVRRICCIGAGPIGAGWTASFLARAYTVTAYVHEPGEEASLRSLVEDAWVSLEALGLAEGASLENLHCTSDLAEAVADVEFVQESAPENLVLKQALYERLGELVPQDVVIASSTSGLTMSDIQARCSSPERSLVGHPFNPPYLLPLVEIVGGARTDPEAVLWAGDFYRAAGKAPLVLKKEIPGFVATRLQEALWREALWLLHDKVATAEEIDAAIAYGPGLRWAQMGTMQTFHLAGGEGGMRAMLAMFGPCLKWPWTKLMDVPELTDEFVNVVGDQCEAQAGGLSPRDLETIRDDNLIAILQALKSTNWGAGKTLARYEQQLMQAANDD